LAQDSGDLPGLYLLRACTHVLRLLGEAGATVEELDRSYAAVASGAIFTSQAFREAQAFLLNESLVRIDHGIVRPNLPEYVRLTSEEQGAQQLARWILLERPPLWLVNAVGDGSLSTALIPSEVEDRIEHIFPNLAEREAILLAAAQKHDETLSAAAGALGEEHILSECARWLSGNSRPDLASKVQRLSLISDRLGYDVSAPDLGETLHQLEVKAFSGPELRFFLTRNEFEVGLKFPTWALVFVRVDLRNQAATVAGWLPAGAIRNRLPADRDDAAQWESARIRLSESELLPGLPIQIVASGE